MGFAGAQACLYRKKGKTNVLQPFPPPDRTEACLGIRTCLNGVLSRNIWSDCAPVAFPVLLQSYNNRIKSNTGKSDEYTSSALARADG